MTQDTTGAAVNRNSETGTVSYQVTLAEDASFEDWRPYARSALVLEIPPAAIRFTPGENASGDLFSGQPLPGETNPSPQITVPKSFKREASEASLHSAPDRFQLLYRVLWRLRDEPRLMAVSTDKDVIRLLQLGQSVRRDLHKMKAFVRFRRIPDRSEDRFVAWFEPSHHITSRAADFFRRRFTDMAWSLLTPAKSAHWDCHTLVFDKGVSRNQWASIKDGNEDLWKIYFANIFNPARLKTKAMQGQMPKKYWKNLPEAALIPNLVQSAGARTDEMVASPPSPPSLRHTRMAERRHSPRVKT